MSGQLGVDLSSNNAHPIPWPALKAQGVTFAIIKATEANNYVNPFCQQDADEAVAAGVGVSFYHFFQPRVPPRDQAAWFIAHIPPNHYPAGSGWCDQEVTGSVPPDEIAQEVSAWLDAIPTSACAVVGSYLNLSELETLTGAPWGRPLWLANPSAPPGKPAAPCLIQQYGYIRVGAALFDINIFLGTDQQFSALFPTATTGGTPAPVPTPPGPAPAPPSGVCSVNVPVLSHGVGMPPGPPNPAVSNLQALLEKHGFSVGPSGADGRFGDDTQAAVVQCEHRFGLSVDVGVAGPQVWTALCNE